MDYLHKIIGDFEIHSADGIRECLESGLNPNQIHRDKPLVYELINMYLRSSNFKECMRVMVEFGLAFEDKALLAVLCDDAEELDRILSEDKLVISKKYSLDCTFTPIFEASLLHICAEYNHLESAKILLKYGADVNSKAGIDEYGFGGHSPIFHTVNQHNNNSQDMLKFLLSHQADPSLTVKGLIWGKGYEWETFIPSVNPISYAMMGLLRQFQRQESDIYGNIYHLMKSAYNSNYKSGNVPNKYLYS